jgi:hypothetical protein
VLSDEYPDTLYSIYNLAFTLQLQARRKEAFTLIERCSWLREQVLSK